VRSLRLRFWGLLSASRPAVGLSLTSAHRGSGFGAQDRPDPAKRSRTPAASSPLVLPKGCSTQVIDLALPRLWLVCRKPKRRRRVDETYSSAHATKDAANRKGAEAGRGRGLPGSGSVVGWSCRCRMGRRDWPRTQEDAPVPDGVLSPSLLVGLSARKDQRPAGSSNAGRYVDALPSGLLRPQFRDRRNR
jgi:hypothetical protein